MNSIYIRKGITALLAAAMIVSILVVTPAVAFEPTGSYYKYAHFTPSNSCFKGGYDVGGYVHSDGTGYLFVGNGQNCDMYTVSIPAGDDPNMHPDNPYATGPMASRTLNCSIGSYNYYADCGFHSGSINEFIVTEDAIYLGPQQYSSGTSNYAKIYKWTIDWDTLDWTPVGLVVDAKLPQNYYTQTLGYDEEHTTFYTGTASDRNVLSFQVGVDTEWQWEFKHTATPSGSHHDGLEYVAGKLWISDMTSAYILEYNYTGTGSFNGWEEENIFNYTGFPGCVEGMGFGPLGHFWASCGNNLFELGGGELQQELEGIPDQCIFSGEEFETFDLDDYMVGEVDHYAYSGNIQLSVSIDGDNNVTVTYPDDWTGNETITFTAYDADDEVIDSDDATFTVCPVPVVGDIPDQTTPFETFGLDDYLSGIDPEKVTWSASFACDGWTVDIDPLNVVAVTAPEGATEPCTITFTATTSCCNREASDSDNAIFIPNQLPNVTGAYPSMDCLWPPNHKFVDLTIEGVTDPDGDDVTITVTKITSDEPTASIEGAGGAKYAPDADPGCIGTAIARVRSERSGNEDGRVYEITFLASDGIGEPVEGTVQVKVPHDQSGDCVSIDSGQNYDATAVN
ncbi:MAG: hypothetical protein C4B59_09155 [Candidatus Methanogaster sp.]|uniref:Uncharacterized protein n=1 Tax=Candidatus Methanogaster sp. TaxID=3386292 RepID=A0AC61L2J6_9EURY|nr:MAG: hypothetical protein C4B59_09155 [ANME-2 cluster archaeon]